MGRLTAGHLAIIALALMVSCFFIVRASARAVIEVGTDAELDIALGQATGGETILLRPGNYGFHYLPKPYAARITIRGAKRHQVRIDGISTFAAATVDTAAANVLITNLTISSPDDSRDALRINRYSHDIEIAGVTIHGGERCIGINASPYGQEMWPHDITVRDSDLSGSTSDLVQVVGGRDVALRQNFLHDPADNPNDHVDGIQSVASDGLEIVANSFTEPAEGATGFNQAIILGRADPFHATLAVRNSYVANNLIYGWRGSGILLAGTTDTWVVNNTAMPYSGQSGFVTVTKSPSTSGGTAEAWHNTNLRVWNNVFNKVQADSGPGPVFNSNNSVVEARIPYGENPSMGDPGFLSTGGSGPDKYELRNGGSAVDSGIVTPDGRTPRTDVDGLTRDALPDRGAQEYERPPALYGP
jgi:hypothetical protein